MLQIVAAAGRSRRRGVGVVTLVLALCLGAAACGSSPGSGGPHTASEPASSERVPTAATVLPAPKISFAQDTRFFTDVTEADPALVSYEQQEGNVALRALLTDSSAFCALLERGGGFDEALVAEADGARSTETQTSLPLSVTTFNAIESVALLTLCPKEQKGLPASVRSKIRNLGEALATPSG
jgi:hypothetical protein